MSLLVTALAIAASYAPKAFGIKTGTSLTPVQITAIACTAFYSLLY